MCFDKHTCRSLTFWARSCVVCQSSCLKHFADLLLSFGRSLILLYSHKDYWTIASQKLRAEPALAEALDRIQAAALLEGHNLADVLLSETEKRKNQLLQKRWKINLAGKEITLHDKLSKICKSVQGFKDMGSQVAGLDPLHAGLPWAGLCLLMQIALSESDQYAGMVAGVEEVAKVISRYKQVEVICRKRAEVILDNGFEEHLLNLYEQILRYQILAAEYYQRNTVIRILRSIPKLDDVSDVLAHIRGSDSECRELLWVLFTKDEILRHSDVLTFLKNLKEDLSIVSQDVRQMSKVQPMASEAPIEVPFAFDRDPKFTGRMDILEELDAGFKVYRRMALVGWAGIGKSQIAIEYAYRVKNRSPPARIFWVRGARRDAFLKSYRELARQLRLPGWDNPEINVVKLFDDWLRDPTNGAWFMVVDNVDDETTFSSSIRKDPIPDSSASLDVHQLHRYLPQVSHGSILVTSRNRVAARDITNEDECLVFVDRLPEPDALSLLRKKLPKDDSSDEDAKQLVRLLEYLPLAITQAAAYISNGFGRRNISHYLTLFRSDQIRYLEMAANDIRRDSDESDQDFSNSVLKTWFISFKHIRDKNPDAAENLCFMSLVFGHEIPMDYLLCGFEIDPHEVERSIGPLIEFSLITVSTGGTFSIHRLVQLSVRHWLHTNDDFIRNVEIAVSVLSIRFPYAQQDNWRTCELLMPHADVVLAYDFSTPHALEHQSLLFSDTARYFHSRGNWSLSLERASKALEISTTHFGANFHVTRYKAEILIALAHDGLGNNQQAETFARSLATSARQSYTQSDKRMMGAIHVLGGILTSCGKYKEAEVAMREALQLRESHLGIDNTQTLDSLAGLANILARLSDFPMACQMHESLVARSTKAQGPMHSQTLVYIIDYSSTLISMGRLGEAEMLLRDMYLNRVESLTEDHPDTILNLANYVLVLTFQGKVTEAQELNDHALDLTRKNHSEGKNSLLLLHNRGHIKMKMDKVKEAKKILEEIVQLRREHLGVMHPETLLSIHELGRCEFMLGNNKAAESSLEYSWKQFEEQFGEAHYYTMLCTGSMATLRRIQGKLDESEVLSRKNLADSQRVLGLHHHETIKRHGNLAQVLSSKKLHKLAIECISDALTTSTRHYGKDDAVTLSIKHTYASILDESVETYQQAARAYQELLVDYLKSYSCAYSKIVLTRSQYASLLCKLDRYEEAENLCRENVTICQSTLGQINQLTCDALEGLAFVVAQNRTSPPPSSTQYEQSTFAAAVNTSADRKRRRQECLKLRQQVVEIYTVLQGYDEEPTLRARDKLASFLEDEGENDEALKLHRHVMNKRQEVLGLSHPETLVSSHKVANILRKLSRYSEAEALSRQTWDLRESVLGHDDKETMASKNDHALCLRCHGNVKRALQLDQELLDHKKFIFGTDSLEVLHTMNNLAMDYYDLQDYSMAVILLEEVVASRQQKLGPNHDLTLLSTHNLGLNLQKLKRWYEAETVFRKLLAIQISMLGPLHHSVDETIIPLSSCLRSQDKNEEAITLAQEVLQYHEKELGPTHTKTISALGSLAETLHLCKEYLRAESIYKQQFGLRKQVPEKNMRINLSSFQGFAFTLLMLGKYSEAEPWYRRAHKGRQIILGVDHEDTLFSAWSLVACLNRAKRKLGEAEILCRRTIAIREATAGKTHKQTLLMLQQLAFTLNLQGRNVENMSQLEELEARLEESGQENEIHRTILQDLMNVAYGSRQYVKGQSYARKYLHLVEQTHGKDSLEAAHVLSQIAVLSYSQGLFHTSAQNFRNIIRIYESNSKIDDEEHLTMLTSLSEVILKGKPQGQVLKEVQLLCDQAIELDHELSLSSTPRPPICFQSKARISRLLYGLGRYQDSEAVALSVITEGEKVLPASHTALLASRRHIARLMACTERMDEALVLMRSVFSMDIEHRGKNDKGTLETGALYGALLRDVGKMWEAELVLRATLVKKERELGWGSPWTVETRNEYVLLLIMALRKSREM